MSMLRPTTSLLCRRALLTPRLVPSASLSFSLRSLQLAAPKSRLSLSRPFSFSSHLRNDTPSPPTTATTTPSDEIKPYHGPLDSTFRRLKLFSLASLSISFTLAPFMFIVESNLPLTTRFALASIALGTSGLSTAMVGWSGKPYVTALKRTTEPNGEETLEMTTLTLALYPRVTKVYDPYFLVETRRPFAKWELADVIALPPGKDSATLAGHEETIAETFDKDGNVIGRWIVKWGENGEGQCRQVGSVVRYFNVHEELL